MSRNTIILMVALCAGVAGLVIFSKLRSDGDTPMLVNPPANSTPVEAQPKAAPPRANPPASQVAPRQADTISTQPSVPVVGDKQPTVTQGRQTTATQSIRPGMTNSAVASILRVPIDPQEMPADAKPLPVLEKNYLVTTNRDDRLDIMMDIAENSSAETVKALTRLFEAETDPDLKVDLIDSLLGIEGFKEEKLVMLAMGAKNGMPDDVRQSAIDGLIDLDDRRTIPILNGLLNDPNEMIREAAQDALEMIQAEPVVLKP